MIGFGQTCSRHERSRNKISNNSVNQEPGFFFSEAFSQVWFFSFRILDEMGLLGGERRERGGRVTL